MNVNWSVNPFFRNSNHIIKNDYEDINEYCNFLVKCFKNINYLKFNNKPVFYIHHPLLIEKNIMNELKYKLNTLCKVSKF